MHIIVTNNAKLLNLAKKQNEKIIDLNDLNLAISEQPVATRVSTDVNVFMKNKIVDLLISLGIPTHIKGFTYLTYAIFTVLTSPTSLKLTQDVYPNIAVQFKTSDGSVEAAIRNAVIKYAFGDNRTEMLNYVFPSVTDKEYVTCAQFIYDIKTYLQNKYNF